MYPALVTKPIIRVMIFENKFYVLVLSLLVVNSKQFLLKYCLENNIFHV